MLTGSPSFTGRFRPWALSLGSQCVAPTRLPPPVVGAPVIEGELFETCFRGECPTERMKRKMC